MRAMRIGSPAGLETIRVGTAEAPAPKPGEIRVAIRANALNFRDVLVARGILPAVPGCILLSDACGEVTDVGAGVREFAVGDTVVSTFHPAWLDGHTERHELAAAPGGGADGYACEAVTRAATSFTRAPRALSPVQCATLTCAGVTAWRALVTDGRVKPGARVLIEGTGGVSLFALQFAKAAGATVIATSTSADKLARLRELGADLVIDRSAMPQWGAQVLELTDGVGVDHVIEVGGPHTIGQGFVAARTGAHIAIVGALGGFDIDTMPFAVVQAKRLRLQGVTVGSRRDQIEMIRGIEASGIIPVVDRVFPLEQLGEALRYQQDGGGFGKVCVEV
ncbi:MAG: NAD(P)-dependent alcohol dehydrogenase [Novosphingobium sp.]|nr:NAD(P)-dependent alcohol dehydrogenase [Novosphingobium sp.]